LLESEIKFLDRTNYIGFIINSEDGTVVCIEQTWRQICSAKQILDDEVQRFDITRSLHGKMCVVFSDAGRRTKKCGNKKGPF
jgi:hypothetical protein